MTEGNIKALKDLRDVIVAERREAARRGDVETVIAIQQQVVILDAAIADERALGQAQKDEEAMGRALRRPDDKSSIGEVSIVSDAIKIAD